MSVWPLSYRAVTATLPKTESGINARLLESAAVGRILVLQIARATPATSLVQA